MRAPRKPRPPQPLPHKRRSRAPVVGPAIMVFIAANPGVSPHQVHAAIGGSLPTIRTLMSNAKMNGALFVTGLKLRRVYYAKQAEADAGALIPPARRAHTDGPVKSALLAVLESMPGGASPSQLRAATGFAKYQLFDALSRMMKSGQISVFVHKQRRTYFTTEALRDAAQPGIEAAWAERIAAAKAAAVPAHRAQAIACYHRKRALLPEKVIKAKPPKVAKVKAVKPLKPDRLPAVPKPKKAAALVLVKTLINKSKPTAARAGWGRDDPVHITADTIMTVYRSVYVPMPPTSRQFQHGHSGKFAP